jgi:hypothetical protein
MPCPPEVPALYRPWKHLRNTSQYEGNQLARSQALYLQLKECLKQRRVVDYHKFGFSQKHGSEVQHPMDLNRDMYVEPHLRRRQSRPNITLASSLEQMKNGSLFFALD